MLIPFYLHRFAGFSLKKLPPNLLLQPPANLRIFIFHILPRTTFLLQQYPHCKKNLNSTPKFPTFFTLFIPWKHKKQTYKKGDWRFECQSSCCHALPWQRLKRDPVMGKYVCKTRTAQSRSCLPETNWQVRFRMKKPKTDQSPTITLLVSVRWSCVWTETVLFWEYRRRYRWTPSSYLP